MEDSGWMQDGSREAAAPARVHFSPARRVVRLLGPSRSPAPGLREPMKIHEFQAKTLLKRFGVAVPEGRDCASVDEALAAYSALGGGVAVVKAQIHAGGRGKGGGVKVCRSAEEVREAASRILGM